MENYHQDHLIFFKGENPVNGPNWQGNLDSIAFQANEIQSKLFNIERPCYFVRKGNSIGVTNEGYLSEGPNPDVETLTAVPPILPEQLGDPDFLADHKVKYAYMAGAMANGIASEKLVIALGKRNILGSFGAAGLVPARIEKAIDLIQEALPDRPYCFNLIHNPSEPALEKESVNLYIKHKINTIEASAFLDLTPNLVYYRVAGLELNSNNRIESKNKIIAKVSREEIATKFLEPPPEKILKILIERGQISEFQAKLSENIPLADDITVEADSGGHTDNRPLVCLLPSILSLRDRIQSRHQYETPVRIGAAGGMGTPGAILGAFMMGASYVVTGSINQSCLEAGASEHTKNLLALAEMTDVMMAPAADMFEMGVKLQVLKRGTLFGTRARRLFELYLQYNSIEEIPETDRKKLEEQIFRKSFAEVWRDTVVYFNQRDPDQIVRAENNPKRKMALIFRWYLGLSSRWSNTGEKGREMDYQIWCGPSMGAFNHWVQDSYLQDPKYRKVADIAEILMKTSAYLYRLQNLKLQGIFLPERSFGNDWANLARLVPPESLDGTVKN